MDSYFLDWYSDGWGARLGLILIGLCLLLVVLRGARNCVPVVRLLPTALFWRSVVFLYYIFWALPYYGTGGDVWNYHNDGIEIAHLITQGDWSGIKLGLSTQAMNILTGVFYAPFGADVYGFAFFSAVLGLAGSVYLCRTFALWASPEQTRRYAWILLFLPSYAFWAGIIGKDSWIAFGLGLSAYGYGMMQKSTSSRGFWHFMAGFSILTLIRPHVALIIAGAMAAAYIWALTQTTQGSLPMKFLRIAVLTTLVGLLYPFTLNFLGLSENASSENVEEFMRTNGEANARAGGSVVTVQTAPGVTGMIEGIPEGVVRVLLEPFPWQVKNVNAALAAAENLLIAGLLLRYGRRIWALFRGIVRVPYFMFSSFVTVGLLLLFSFLPNLGLISRQRVQLLPFFFSVLVAATPTGRRKAGERQLAAVPPVRSAIAGAPR